MEKLSINLNEIGLTTEEIDALFLDSNDLGPIEIAQMGNCYLVE